jgi:hypothetical protein
MERPNTWRTILPQYQEIVSSKTPTRKPEFFRSHISECFNFERPTQAKTPSRVFQRNQASTDNPLSNPIAPSAPSQLKKTPMKNRESKENPLNYKVTPSKTQRVINTKTTASKIACLSSTLIDPERPIKLNTKNSETFMNFLPGSQYSKTPPVEKPLTKVLNKKNLRSSQEEKLSIKKLKTNKLHNRFSINDQFN